MNINSLVEQLWEAAEAYYRGAGEVLLSDDEYDEKIEELSRRLTSGEIPQDSDRAAKLIDGFIVGNFENQKDFTAVPMLSQDKAKTKEEVRDFILRLVENGASQIKLQAKLDGFSLAATYQKGFLVDLRLRGSGGVGQSIFEKFNSSEHVSQTIFGVPSILTGKFSGKTLEARGEALISYANFAELNKMRISENLDPYSHPRNAAFQIASRNYSGVSIDFFIWQILSGENFDYSSAEIFGTGFKSVEEIFSKDIPRILPIDSPDSIDSVMASIKSFGDIREDLDFPTDGIVVKPVNENELNEKLGFTNHHPLSQIAFKYPGTTAKTRVVSTALKLWSDGELVGQVIVDPVNVGGMTARTLSMETSSKIFELGVKAGNEIVIELYHDVKLRLKSVLDSEGPIPLPKNCPFCGSEFLCELLPPDLKKGVYSNYTKLMCPNYSCQGRQEALITKVFKNSCDLSGRAKSLVNGLTDKTALQLLPKNGIWLDVFEAKEESIAECVTPSGGSIPRANVQKIFKNLFEAKNEISPELILAGSGVERLTGSRAILLVEKFGSISSLLSASPDEISKLLSIDDYTEKSYSKPISGEKIQNSLRSNPIVFEAIKRGYVI